MDSQHQRTMQVVKRDEKEAMLTQFVLAEIASGRVSLNAEWRVLALAPDSPVISALQRVVRELGCAEHLSIRAVLICADKKTAQGLFDDVDAVEVRSTQNARMLDAHEQLVLGTSSSWAGDCMRRNPRERDAFETFGADDEQLADWGAKSFERIWMNAEPIGGHGCVGQPGQAFDDLLPADHPFDRTTVVATSRN